jgi:hypothetical protein
MATRRKLRPCGARVHEDGILRGLDVGGPCSSCGAPVSARGGHVQDEPCALFCESCCPVCRDETKPKPRRQRKPHVENSHGGLIERLRRPL